MSVSIAEQETTVSWYRDEDTATVYTSDRTVMTKLDKLAYDSASPWICYKQDYVDDEVVAKWYKAPKSLICFRSAKVQSHMTDEQKAQAAERLRSLRQKANLET